MSKFGKVLVVAAAGIGVLAGGAVAAQIKLRYADGRPSGFPCVEAVKHMGEILKKETDGRLQIEVFASGQLGKEADVIAKIRSGEIDMMRIDTPYLHDIAPELAVTALPFLFRSEEHLHKVVDGPLGDEILKYLEPYGIVGLALYDSSARSIYNTKKPIRTPEDARGLKIRVKWSDIQRATFEAMGAVPTDMKYGELFDGLKDGAVDGAENNWLSYWEPSHYVSGKYWSSTEHTMQPDVLMISKKVWDKLTPEDQAAMRKAAKESVVKIRGIWARLDEDAKRTSVENGVTINDVDKDAFVKAMQPVYDKFLTDAGHKNLFERIRAVK